MYQIIIENPDIKLKKILNDKYFTISSLDTLINEHNLNYPVKPENADKKFYFRLRKDLEKRGITEENFLTNLSDDLLENVNFTKFINSLKGLVT